jgi:hypothetical protein
MRILKFSNQFNWKYIFGEILLIFIGISLAIWFNNWNSSIKSTKEKEIAISKIEEEIQSNIKEIIAARKINQSILDAYSEYKKIYKGTSSELISTSEHLNTLQRKYPNFFTVSDSVKQESGSFLYTGTTFINLELAELSQIAWETTRSINTTNEFDYECLYELESMYNLQRRVENEIEKAANALQKQEINELMSILIFLNQYDIQLEKDYQNMLENIKNCR